MGRFLALPGAALVAALAVWTPAWAQPLDSAAIDSPVLVIDQERLFRQSALGTRITEELEDAAAALAAENREIEAQLSAEELRLTEQRATLPPEEFRALADAFDQKVQRLRSEQDQKERELQRRRDADQQVFINQIGPILGQVAQERSALIVLDRRAAFLVSDAIDITDELIARVDASIAAEDAEEDGEAAPSVDDAEPGAQDN
ncbi:OmpH family outer membrane protein [Anianabacter salinae]|uniref:OmpH family outer membrane protein n=1 Tax=Anianabacter salinae TaxID=2851023 RepID=UPI00225DEEE0|nr:OmpH family outer membrane protein [Anianabacter salinae]MBV0911986.1 OmpH family outer membrane protein [Anianabacter salinae]